MKQSYLFVLMVCLSVSFCMNAEAQGNFQTADAGVVSPEDAMAAWGNVCVGRDRGKGYRYNPLIVIDRQVAIDSYLMATKRADTAAIRGLAGSRMRFIQNDALFAEMPEWAVWPQGRGVSTVFFAPTYLDAYHECPGNVLTPIEDQYALFYEEQGPRAMGSICDPVPTIAFLERNNYINIALTSVYQSTLLDGTETSLEAMARSGDDFAKTLARVASIARMQCGILPFGMTVTFEGKDPPITLPFVPAFEAKLEIADTGQVLYTVIKETPLAFNSKRTVERQRNMAAAMAERKAKAEENFAMGALLIIGSFALINAMERNDCVVDYNKGEEKDDLPSHCDDR